MITPSFALTATERVLPRLALDFTTASLDPRVTFTRTGNTATVTNSSGTIVAINADLPRFDFNPTTLVCRGLLIEEARTNALVNSLIDGTNLTTQIVTTTAVAYTLSFYGTGNIVLSGTSSSTQTGSGAYPSRKTHTFTPTAGSLTLTVTGTVQFAQLETGSFVTSFIPTAGSAVTRNRDIASMTGTNFSDWYNATEGAVLIQSTSNGTPPSGVSWGVLSFNNGTATSSMNFYRNGGALYIGVPNTEAQYSRGAGNATNVTFAYALNNTNSCIGTSLGTTDTSFALQTCDRLQIGGVFADPNYSLNGCVKKISYWPQRITNAELQAFARQEKICR